MLIVRNAAGVAGVSGSTTVANSFASFLLDRPNQFGRDLPLIFPTFIQRPWFSYVQDKWQVNQKLTVDIGLRHEYHELFPAIARGEVDLARAAQRALRHGLREVDQRRGRRGPLLRLEDFLVLLIEGDAPQLIHLSFDDRRFLR